MLTFSSFAVLRAVTLFSVYTFSRTEALYAVLSLVAKTQLSWFLFIGVLQDMTTEGGEVELQTEGEALEGPLAVFLSTMTVGVVLAFVVVKYVNEEKSDLAKPLIA
jgi:pheromone shutdown protein TraB